MLYSSFQEKQLSLLGFGTMRLPQLPNGDIDEDQTKRMVDYAMKHGVNYFDTAWPYHNGQSERIIGRLLQAYDRESYYLATKYPGHQISTSYDPASIFEAQLEKCGVDYFDFYLLHNVYEKSLQTYLDPQWGILDYFIRQKKLGRIRHLGFSTHGSLETMTRFLDACAEHMEFCQIQLNYLDWTLQQAREKCLLLSERNIPIWVMEPVRGGKLASLSASHEALLKAARPDETIAAWSFRFLQGLPNIKMILSGMSNFSQMEDNIRTFSQSRPLTDSETALLFSVAGDMLETIPCTLCRYCCSVCPMGLDIPELLSIYNEIRFAPVVNAGMRVEALPEDKKPSACISCGSCSRMCPQNIDIPGHMRDFSKALEQIPSWAEICRQRDAAQK